MSTPRTLLLLCLLGAASALAEERPGKARGDSPPPTYDVEQVGTGSVALTAPGALSASIVLTHALEGQFFLLDARGRTLMTWEKRPGRPLIELGLAPGDYRLRRELGRSRSETPFTLEEGQRVELTPLSFGAFIEPPSLPRRWSRYSWSRPLAPWDSDEEEGVAIRVPPPRVVLPVAGSLFLRRWSTNTELAGEQPVENHWALGAVNGGTTLRGLALALVGNWYEEEAQGVLLAGVGNRVLTDTYGLQASGGVNWVEGRFDGVQASFGINTARQEVRGLQVSVLGNLTEQALEGVQVSGGVNGALKGMRGVQVGGFMNDAERLKGLQVGLINFGKDVTGAQVGLFNIARGVVRGTQIGLLNASKEMRGVPLGPFSFQTEGWTDLETWVSDIQLANLALKFRGRYVYSLLMVGVGPDDRLRRFSLGMGLGSHLPLGERFWLEADVAGSTLAHVDPPGILLYGGNVLAQVRLMLGLQLFEYLALFAGPTYNTYFAWKDVDRLTLTTLPVRQRQVGRDVTMQYWPGVQLGLRL